MRVMPQWSVAEQRVRIELERVTRTAQQLALLLQPDGGQGRARRNAWRGLSEDRQRREQRIEAERWTRPALPSPQGERRAVEEYLPEQRRVVAAV